MFCRAKGFQVSRFLSYFFVVTLLVVGRALVAPSLHQAHAQGRISSFELRPFVTGIIPVVGPNGAVGGVVVDAKGALARATVDELGVLRAARRKALRKTAPEFARATRLRKVSLRRLEAAMRRCAEEKKPLPDEILFLAGLTHIEYVFLYPEQKDIVLAGPAEAWRIDKQGTVVGSVTGTPTLLLADLVTALRIAEPTLETGIRCSMDPTERGLRRLTELLGTVSSRNRTRLARRAEEALGPQKITLTGAPADSNFAHVLVAADFLMKRFAMGLEKEAGGDELIPASYLELLREEGAEPPRNSTPRWWLAPEFRPLSKSPDEMAWRVPSCRVITKTEEGFLTAAGEVADVGRAHPMAQRWADQFTAAYEKIAAEYSVFGQLRSCINLAAVGMLIYRERLARRAECELPLLLGDRRWRVGGMHVPKTVDSQARLFRMGRRWVMSVSGGVDIDAYAAVEKVRLSDKLEKPRRAAEARAASEQWWWN